MWILTRELNEYDQYGEYFEAAWINKPTEKELYQTTGYPKELCEHILKGGGRRDDEYIWFHLSEVNEGELYELKNQ